MSINQGFTHNTASSGIIELKEAIIEKLKKESGAGYIPSGIIVSNGAKQCLFNAILTLCNPGDEVLLPIPCWASYTEQIKFVQAVPSLSQLIKRRFSSYRLLKWKKRKLRKLNYSF